MKPFFLIFLQLFSLHLVAQNVIKGKVTDFDSGELLMGANIVIGGTASGTLTDIDGEFELQVKEGDEFIVISYVGYDEVRFEIKDYLNTYLNARLGEFSPLFCSVKITVRASSPINLRDPTPQMEILPIHLQRDLPTTIAPALNRVPGVYMHSGALNTNRITIRGIGNRSPFSTTKIRAYLDDIPLTSGDGETTIEDIDLSIIDRVKVYKGPTASQYGAGLGGMIHLQTANNQEIDYRSSLQSNFTLGSYGLLRNSTTANLSKNKFNLRLNYNNTHSDGYRENNQYDRQGFALLGKYKANETTETTLFANYADVKAFIPSSLNRTDYDENPRRAAFNWASVSGFEDYNKLLLGAAHKTQIWKNKKVEINNRSSVFASTRENYESRPFNILQEESWTLGARTNVELKPRGYSATIPKITAGAEVFRENYNWQTFVTNEGVQGNLLSDNDEIRNYYNLFAQADLRVDKFQVQAGLNLNNTQYTYTDLFLANGDDLSGDYSFDPVLSPRLGISYLIDYKYTIFGNISHGFSPPTLSETLTPEGTINPNIQPEKGWNFELGTRGSLNNKRLEYELSLYEMRVQDLLVARRVTEDQFVGINAGKTQHRGLETYFSYLWAVGKFEPRIWMTYTYSDYKFLDFIDGENDYSGNELTGTPPHNFNAGLDLEISFGFYGNVNYQYLATYPMRDDNTIYTEDYSLVNAKLGYKKRLGNKFELDFNAGINNIFNEKYASMILINARSFGGNAPRYYYPALPVNFYGGMRLKYIFS